MHLVVPPAHGAAGDKFGCKRLEREESDGLARIPKRKRLKTREKKGREAGAKKGGGSKVILKEIHNTRGERGAEVEVGVAAHLEEAETKM